jgi:uncharacterized RDD family membrane protein YckC
MTTAPRAPLDTDVAIEIPEHIVFRHRLAGPTRRAFAQMLDLVICYGALAVVVLLVHLVAPAVRPGALGRAGTGVILLLLFATQWIYFVVWEGWAGRTPGKMAVGARVVTSAGRPIGWTEAALRNLLRAADLLPTAYLTGVIAMALSSRFQRLGDLVAGTIVVLGEAPDAPRRRGDRAPLGIGAPPTSAELAALPPVVTLDADERTAIELFLLRRPSLGVARERELAAILAQPLAAAIGVQPGSPLERDPARLLALVHRLAVNAGRTAAPPSLRPGARRP